MVEAEDGNYWLTGHENIYLFSPASKKVLKRLTFSDTLNVPLVQDVVPIENGLIIATEGSGLFTFL